jgi:hypothetical protein
LDKPELYLQCTKKETGLFFFNTWVLQQKFEANGSRETFPSVFARACFEGSTFLRRIFLALKGTVHWQLRGVKIWYQSMHYDVLSCRQVSCAMSQWTPSRE